MDKRYTKKQIKEAIAYWEKKLENMNESNVDLPDSLYHATSNKIAAEIEKHGIYPGGTVQWKDLSKEGVTYWANSPTLAALYARMKGLKRNEIAIFEAPIKAFNTSKLRPDRNYPSDMNSGAFEYKGGIAAKDLKRIEL